MEELARLLRSRKLVTISGPGGVGKTRLAVETVLTLLSDFAGGVFLVPLADSRNEENAVFERLRETLEVTQRDLPERAAFRKFFGHRECLIIFDNLESVPAASGLIVELATLPGVTVLLTSQRPAGLEGEVVFRLDPMNTSGVLSELESYRLFLRIAKDRDNSWEPEDQEVMKDVLRLTDGLPYLIELIACRAPRRNISQVADELLQRITKVRSESRGPSKPRRHESVEACLRWTLDLLKPRERKAFLRLSVTAGGFDAAAALKIALADQNTLDQLVNFNLLQFDRMQERYFMLHTTLEFAKVHLGQESDSLAKAHAYYYAGVLDQGDNDLRAPGADTQSLARKAITTEIGNVSRAIEWARERDGDLLRRLVGAFNLFLSQTYQYRKMASLNEEVLSKLTERDFPVQWATTQNNLGNAYSDLPTGDRAENLKKAIACYEAALRVYTERDFPVQWATTNFNMALAYSLLIPLGTSNARQRAIVCLKYSERAFRASGMVKDADQAADLRRRLGDSSS